MDIKSIISQKNGVTSCYFTTPASTHCNHCNSNIMKVQLYDILEKIDNTDLSTQFSTLVFENPSKMKQEMPVIQPARNLALSQAVQIVFIGPPIAITIFIIIWAKWSDKLRKKKSPMIKMGQY